MSSRAEKFDGFLLDRNLIQEELAVCARGLGKSYRLWSKPEDRLKQSVRSALANLLPVKNREYFQEFWAMENISFDVRKGESIGIIGRNGSGKSTLLQIVCGTLTPTVGSLSVNGRIGALLELGSGFNPEFTGRENVYLNAAILGLEKQEVDERFGFISEFADIGEFMNQPVKIYSSGMYLRLAFATAVQLKAEILVIDEALAVGDAFFMQKCIRRLRQFREEGTLLLVSHDTSAILTLCDRAILLEKGRVKADGPAQDVCDLYLKTLFGVRQCVDRNLNSPPINNESPKNEREDIVDQRLKFLNHTQYRNDLELFNFDPNAESFGHGGASILEAKFCELDTENQVVQIVGGERVILKVKCKSHQELTNVVIGFYIRDRLGQNLFGDNNLVSSIENPFEVASDKCFEASFTFRMPILPVGDYSVTVAVAEYRPPTDYLVHHWMHNAIRFKSNSSSNCTGLVGIPMERILIYESAG